MADTRKDRLAHGATKPAPADVAVQKARQLAHSFDAEESHSGHVTALALSLWDQLRPVHRLDDRARVLLQCAGTLHDIGWLKGRQGHHKESAKMILAAEDLGLTAREHLVVANVARYHRKALPDERHGNYRKLSGPDRLLVSTLAGILRLADGMDVQHLARVQTVAVKTAPRQITVACQTSGDAGEEMRAARNKSDLLKLALHRRVVLKWPAMPAGRSKSAAKLAHP
jgi:exopolyphosphatase / guanosine-5'-triphosphate,3'-diphosphate pyrophosphatase